MFLDIEKDSACNVGFWTDELSTNRAISENNFHGVVVGVHGFSTVRNNHVAAFAGHLHYGSKSNVLSFKGETNDPLASPFRGSQRGNNVLGFDQRELIPSPVLVSLCFSICLGM